MRQFITKKRIKVPRYKLYYWMFAGTLLTFFFLSVFIHLFCQNINQERFLPILLGNSFGTQMKSYSPSIQDYFYLNSFGLSILEDETVMGENPSLEDVVTQDLTKIVYLYNTFQTDQYKNNYFSSYSIGAYVLQASFILSEYLKNYDIGSFVEEESMAKVLKEENIPYTNSYAASRILLERRKKELPSLQYYFDLQISDYDREATTVEIDHVSYAKILFVVGTDNGNYTENQNFAIRLNEILEEKYQELSRGVSLRGGAGYQGVYNQDFSPRTLLIQVGGIHNTIDEVNRSLNILAEVLATYMKEENNEEE